MLKKYMFLTLAAVTFLTAGCTTTFNRMERISGGILDGYFAMPDQKTRTERMNPGTGGRSGGLSGWNKTSVNLWPLYFQSGKLISILWPMIDIDSQGFAVRPLFEKDGEQYSVLSPLIDWNSREGHILTYVWKKGEYFSFLPLFWHSRNKNNGSFWYTPFLIHSWNDAPFRYIPTSDSFNKTLPRARRQMDNFAESRNTFTEILLAYHSKKRIQDTREWDWLLDYGDLQRLQNEIAYRYPDGKIKVPKDKKEMNKLQDQIRASCCPFVMDTFSGFFPLIHWSNNGMDGHSFRLLYFFPDVRWNTDRKTFSWSLLGHLLGKYSSCELPQWTCHHSGGYAKFGSIALMSRFSSGTYYDESKEKDLQIFREIRRFHNLKKARPAIEKLLKELDPSLILPKTVVDNRTLELFLNDLAKGKQYATYREYCGMILPLFYYRLAKDSTRWMIFPLLTRYSRDSGRTNFWSLPLMTFANKTPQTNYFGILPPFIFRSQTENKTNRIDCPIFSQDTKWVNEHQNIAFRSDYAACGLYYYGKDFFYVAKKEYDSSDVEYVRSKLRSLNRRFKYLEERKNNIEAERKRILERKVKTPAETADPDQRIRYHEKMISLERLIKQGQSLEKDRREFRKDLAELKKSSEAIRLPFDEKNFGNDKA